MSNLTQFSSLSFLSPFFDFFYDNITANTCTRLANIDLVILKKSTPSWWKFYVKAGYLTYVGSSTLMNWQAQSQLCVVWPD